ncbi:LCP family protein [Thermogemmatispora sp.]|uniref:LCP family protein n=1 Tax=Thermogemmatispora sp. TaxID=1968838 RepID=UPI001D9445DF|nr:LCP family protein [Thermogemmatispora sp.]MBX5448603.1 LCP family protein [Thermogemmatispora sp.]
MTAKRQFIKNPAQILNEPVEQEPQSGLWSPGGEQMGGEATAQDRQAGPAATRSTGSGLWQKNPKGGPPMLSLPGIPGPAAPSPLATPADQSPHGTGDLPLPLSQPQGLPPFSFNQVSSHQTDANVSLNHLPDLLKQGPAQPLLSTNASGGPLSAPGFGPWPGPAPLPSAGPATGELGSTPASGSLAAPAPIAGYTGPAQGIGLTPGTGPLAMEGPATAPPMTPLTTHAASLPGLSSSTPAIGPTPGIDWPSSPGGWSSPPQQAPLYSPSPARPSLPRPTRQGQKRRRRFPLWARIVAAICLVLFLLTGAAVAYYYYAFAGTVNNIVGQQVPRLRGDSGSDSTRNNSGGSILSGGRFNILLLGSDTDEKFAGHYIAQTDIVVTIDPATHSVGMLSIPRDFWLPIPGVGMGKLDEAYGYGGVALSRATIHADFGIPIDYYAWVGLDGFVKVIDTVGGVDVDIMHPITDDTYPDDVGNTTGDIHAYKRLYIAPGPQHLTGLQALEYVRSRHADLVGDFGRSARQQQVLTQLKSKLDNPEIFSKLQEIAQDLNGYVKTDLTLPQVLELMNFARTINTANVQRVTLGPPYSHAATVTRNGQSVDVEIPNCEALLPVIAKMFALGDKAQCNIGTADKISSSVVAQAAGQTGQAYSAVQSSLNVAQNAQGANPLSTAGQMANLGLMSLQNGSSDNLLGMRSLLDLMLAVVFESFDAAQV